MDNYSDLVNSKALLLGAVYKDISNYKSSWTLAL